MGIGMTSGIEKEMKCTAAVATQYLLAKFGADDDTLAVAAGATDGLIGIFQHVTTAGGQRIRVMLDGISSLVLGDTVTRGGPITSDANGKGVPATLGQNIVGFAMKSGVSGDIIPVLIEPGVLAPNQAADGLTLKGLARATYDVSVDGGDTGDHGLGVTLPDNAIVTRSFYEIITGFTSAGGDGTIAIKAEGAGDVLAAVDADTLSGLGEGIQDGTAANMIKTTAAREITATVGTEALTAGKAVFFLEYVISL